MRRPQSIGRDLLWCAVLYVAQPFPALSGMSPVKTAPLQVGTTRNGEHDFDFEIGTWKTHLTRLQHPLTGSTAWVDYEGTTVVRKVWSGRANLAELEVDGPAGHLEILSLRLYDPQAHQWSLNTASSKGGTISVPTIGEFKNGRGEFFRHRANEWKKHISSKYLVGHHSGLLSFRTVILSGWRQDLGSKLGRDRRAGERR